MSTPGWVLDLDGVIWLGDEPIAGSAEACERLALDGVPLLYVTNMSRLTVGDQEAKLGRHGIDASGRVVTSAMAAATMVAPGERALVIGGPGVVEALERREVDVVAADARCDVVVVGMDPAFDYDHMKAATLAIRGGARFVATNHDPTFPTPEGLVPGAGAIVSAIEVASGRTATVCGKPHPPMVDLVHGLVGAEGVVVGDRADTDGAFAVALGFDFALVFSGATSRADLPVAPTPVHAADDQTSLVDVLAGEPAR